MGGVAKMWYNILPYIIKVVKEAGGHFTNCMVGRFEFEGASNVMCQDLSRIPALPGKKKVVSFLRPPVSCMCRRCAGCLVISGAICLRVIYCGGSLDAARIRASFDGGLANAGVLVFVLPRYARRLLHTHGLRPGNVSTSTL